MSDEVSKTPVEQQRDDVAAWRLAANDVSAFEHLVHTHRSTIERVTCRLLSWSPEVQDVVQDVFVLALEKLPRFRRECSVSTWLTRITINACRAHLRRAGLRKALFWRRREQFLSGPSARSDQAAIEEERFQKIRRALQALRPVLREVVVLRYLEEWSVEEIAAAVRTSASSVNVRLHRARVKLRELLRDVGEEHE